MDPGVGHYTSRLELWLLACWSERAKYASSNRKTKFPNAILDCYLIDQCWPGWNKPADLGNDHLVNFRANFPGFSGLANKR